MNALVFLFIADSSNRILRNQFVAGLTAFILTSLMAAIGSLIDGVVIGQFLGVDAMAAFGLVSSVVVVYSLVGAILASGARNLFTMMICSGDVSGAIGIFSLSMVLSIGTSVLMMLGHDCFCDAPVHPAGGKRKCCRTP